MQGWKVGFKGVTTAVVATLNFSLIKISSLETHQKTATICLSQSTNFICTDYVTEKFFRIIVRNIVPVVYGGEDHSSIAPPHSQIDARLFKPQELANYLLMLDANETLYNEYFWWKDYYYVEAGQEQMVKRGFCELCKKLFGR